MGQRLPATLLLDYPSIEALSGYLLKEVLPQRAGAESKRVAEARRMALSRRVVDEPIAVVGMACRLPGAPDLGAYWRLLTHGEDVTGEIPSERWQVGAVFDVERGVPGKTYARWGAFVSEVASFDAAHFVCVPRKPSRWTRSSACYSRRHGQRSNMRGTILVGFLGV